MRKVFWCCLAGGAAVCGAIWTAAYVMQNPTSPVGRVILAAVHPAAGCPGAAGPADPSATAEADNLIPPDPVPVEEPPDQPATPVTPDAAPHLPPAVTALIPPIVIHDEEDLNSSSGPDAKTKPPVVVPVDVENAKQTNYAVGEIGRRLDGGMKEEWTARPPMMPHCTDENGPAPMMPRCADDDSAPTMPRASDESNAACGAFDAGLLWMGFCSGPTQLVAEPPAPVVGRTQPSLPGMEEPSEPPAPKDKAVDPMDLFSHPHPPLMPRPADPQSDTMEMRPTDWKPYSLEPGPF